MELKQHFIKSHDFKTVLGTGVFGGLTGQGLINMVVFTERVPLPDNIVVEIDEEVGAVKKEVSRETKEGVVREIHFGVLFDIDTAKATAKWLTNQIENVEQILAQTK